MTEKAPRGSARSEAVRWVVRGIGLALGIGVVLAGVLIGAAAWRVLLLVFFAILLGSALDPLVGTLRSRVPIARGTAILSVYIVFFGVVLVLAFIVLPGALTQASSLAEALPAALERLREQAGQVQPQALAASLTAIVDAGLRALEPGTDPLPDDVVAFGLTVADIAVSIITMLALVYFWMTESPRLLRFALSFVPPERRAGTRDAWNDIEVRLGGWVRGQLTLMGVIAVATGSAYAILGLPSALLLGLIAGLAEGIPMVGPAIGAVPALAVAAILRPDLLIFVIIAYVIIHAIEGNVLVPKVMRNAVGLSPFLVVVSLLVGGAVGGLIGALVAVPIVASMEVVLERMQDRDVPVAQDSAAGATEEDEMDPQAGTAPS
ncbi:MAG: AI-2E family transporter [Chloroflexota bacterium]|nr:AI-2E family transporter [Chloroflexota bacterium]